MRRILSTALTLLLIAAPLRADDAVARAKFLAGYTPSFKAYVFGGDTFPECILEQKAKLQELLGDFALKITFYDRSHQGVTSPKQPGPYGAVVELQPKTGRPLRRFVTLYRCPPKVPADLRFRAEDGDDFARALGLDAAVVRRQPTVIADTLRGPRLNSKAALVAGAFAERMPGLHLQRPFAQWTGDPRAGRLLAGLSLGQPSKELAHRYDDALALERQWWVTLKRRLNGWDTTFAKPFDCPRVLDGKPAPIVRTGTLADAGFLEGTPDKIDAACRAFAADTDQAFAVCVVRHGVIVFHRAYGTRDGKPMTVETKSWMASVTKTMSATLMLMMIDQGLVDFDDSVEKFFPSLKGIKIETPLKIRNLYTHTNGLDRWPGWDDQLPDVEERLAAYYDHLEVGKRWAYQGAGNTIGCKILEAISGEALPQFYQRHLFAPLGCTGTDVIGAHADAYSTPLDMAKFGQMLLNRGAYGEWRFFRSETFEKMLPRKLTTELGPDTTKTFGFGLDGRPTKFGHGAASAATFSVDMDNDLVVIMTRNQQGRNQDKYQGKIWEAIQKGMIGKK